MTEIKEKEFYQIIYTALKEINQDEEKCKKQLEAIKELYKDSKTYYKEIAITQAEVLYEVHADLMELDFWMNLKKKL